jgi:hypothetical protein
MTLQPANNEPTQETDRQAKEADLQSQVVPQAELDAQLPGHVPNAAERAAGGASPWLSAAQADQEPPAGTPPGDLFFTYQRPDGDSFIGPASSAELYLRKGYTVTGEQTIANSAEFRDKVSPGSAAPAVSGVAGLGGSGETEEGPTNTPAGTAEPSSPSAGTAETTPTETTSSGTEPGV